jgi:hypothetical protein
MNYVDGALHCVPAPTVSPEEGSSNVVSSQDGAELQSSVQFLSIFFSNDKRSSLQATRTAPSPLQCLTSHVFIFTPTRRVGRHSSVGIATRYRFDGPGSNPGGGRGSPYPSRPALGSTQPPIHCVPGLFSRGKAAGAWR